MKSREAAGVLVGDRQRRHLLGEGIPAGPGVDRQAGVEPAGDDESRVQLGTEARRDGEPSLVVHRVPVLAGEHLRNPHFGCGAWSWRCAMSARRGVPLPHFGPLHTTCGHHSARNGPVNGQLRQGAAWQAGGPDRPRPPESSERGLLVGSAEGMRGGLYSRIRGISDDVPSRRCADRRQTTRPSDATSTGCSAGHGTATRANGPCRDASLQPSPAGPAGDAAISGWASGSSADRRRGSSSGR